jgi:hypothetical protein
MTEIKFKNKKELLEFIKRFTDNLVNNTKEFGIFSIEDEFEIFYVKDIRKALNETLV